MRVRVRQETKLTLVELSSPLIEISTRTRLRRKKSLAAVRKEIDFKGDDSGEVSDDELELDHSLDLSSSEEEEEVSEAKEISKGADVAVSEDPYESHEFEKDDEGYTSCSESEELVMSMNALSLGRHDNYDTDSESEPSPIKKRLPSPPKTKTIVKVSPFLKSEFFQE